MLNRLPRNETLRPYLELVLNMCQQVLDADDAEGNGTLALHIMFELHKAYRTSAPQFVKPFVDFAVRLYGQFDWREPSVDSAGVHATLLQDRDRVPVGVRAHGAAVCATGGGTTGRGGAAHGARHRGASAADVAGAATLLVRGVYHRTDENSVADLAPAETVRGAHGTVQGAGAACRGAVAGQLPGRGRRSAAGHWARRLREPAPAGVLLPGRAGAFRAFAPVVAAAQPHRIPVRFQRARQLAQPRHADHLGAPAAQPDRGHHQPARRCRWPRTTAAAAHLRDHHHQADRLWRASARCAAEPAPGGRRPGCARRGAQRARRPATVGAHAGARPEDGGVEHEQRARQQQQQQQKQRSASRPGRGRVHPDRTHAAGRQKLLPPVCPQRRGRPARDPGPVCASVHHDEPGQLSGRDRVAHGQTVRPHGGASGGAVHPAAFSGQHQHLQVFCGRADRVLDDAHGRGGGRGSSARLGAAAPVQDHVRLGDAVRGQRAGAAAAPVDHRGRVCAAGGHGVGSHQRAAGAAGAVQVAGRRSLRAAVPRVHAAALLAAEESAAAARRAAG
eukprot:ctg_2387.g572